MTPPPPKKKLKHVNELNQISESDSYLRGTGAFGSRNKLVSSTPSTSYSEVVDEIDSRPSTSGLNNSNASLRSGEDTLPLTDDTFTPTAHLEGTRSLFAGYSPRYSMESLQKSNHFSVDSFSTNRTPKMLQKPKIPMESTANVQKSPFYMGRTMFGGASSAFYSETTRKFAASLLEEEAKRKPPIKIQPINLQTPEEQSLSHMSHTARRILAALEEYARPMTCTSTFKTATPMPALVQNAKRFGNLDRSLNRSRDNNDNSPVLASKPYARPTPSLNSSYQKELQVATIPELLKILQKNKLQQSTLAARKIALSSTSELNKRDTTYKLRMDDDKKFDNKSTSKVKTKIVNVRGSKSAIELEQPVPALDLPSVKLNITTMPTFDNIKLPLNISTSKEKLQANPSLDQERLQVHPPLAKEKLPTSPSCSKKKLQLNISPNKDKLEVNPALNKEKLLVNPTSNQEKLQVNPSPNNEKLQVNPSLDKGKLLVNLTPSKEKLHVNPSLNNQNLQVNLSPNKKKLQANLSHNKEKLQGEFFANKDEVRIETSVKKNKAIPVISDIESSKLIEKKQKSLDILSKQYTFAFPCHFPKISQADVKDECLKMYEFQAPIKISPNKNNIKKIFDKPRKNEKVQMDKLLNVNNKKKYVWECQICYANNDSHFNKCFCCTQSKKGDERKILYNSNKSLSSKLQCSSKESTKLSSANVEKTEQKAQKSLGNNTQISNTFQDLLKQQKQKWECSQCLTRNDLEETSCVCCALTRVDNLAITLAIQSANFSPYQDLLKKQSKKWKCSQCLTHNENGSTKCLCCEAPRTIVKSNVSKDKNTAANSLQNILESQKKKWECSQCLTRNDFQNDKCVCCEVSKTGLKESRDGAIKSVQKSVITIENISPALSHSFQDIVKKQTQKWECQGCLTRNDPQKTKCACCEAAKPGSNPEKNTFNFSSVPMSEFKFGMDKASDDIKKLETAKPSEPSLPAMVSKDNSSANLVEGANATFTFGMPKPNDIKKEENKVNELQFLKKESSSVTPPFVFGMPQSITGAKEKDKEVAPANDKPMFKFGTTSKNPNPKITSISTGFASKEPSTKSTSISTGFGTSAPFAQLTPSNNITVSNIIPTPITITSKSDNTAVSTAPLSSKGVFSFGTTMVSSTFNGSNSESKKSENIATPLFQKPQQTDSPLFNLSNTKAPGNDNGEAAFKKTGFNFSPNIASPGTFGSNLKLPFSTPEPKPAAQSVFQFGSNVENTAQKSVFSFGSNTSVNKSTPFVFGNNNNASTSTSANANASPFVFGAPANQTQDQSTAFVFGGSKPSNFMSNQETASAPSIFGPSATSNTQSNMVFGTSNANSVFSFGANNTQPAAQPSSAMFSFGSNAKPSDGVGGFKFSMAQITTPTQQPAANNLNFGTDLKQLPAVQFQMGAGSTEGRKIKKAVRRTPR